MLDINYLNSEIKRKNIKKSDIADSLNVSRGAVSHILSGTRNPSINLAIKLIRFLELDPYIFLNLDKRLERDHRNAK